MADAHPPTAADISVSMQDVGKTFASGVVALDRLDLTSGRANSSRCSGRRAAASRRRCG